MNKSDSHAECALLWHTYLSVKYKNVGLWSWKMFYRMRSETYFIITSSLDGWRTRTFPSIRGILISIGVGPTEQQSRVGKLNSFTGEQRPNVFLQAQKLIKEAELVSWQTKSREPGQPVKTKKILCNTRREN